MKKYRIEIYTGKLNSLKNLVKNLKLNPEDYMFDVMTKKVYIRIHGLMLSPNDYYLYRLPQKYKIK